jgi:GNAT superfamily N-acetyltransferase
MTVELVELARPDQWEAFHHIRRTVLFEGRGRYGVYDADHPDDRLPDSHPLLFVEDGRPCGAVRIDLLGEERAGVRLVAIDAACQGRGLGRAMMALVERYAAERGAAVLELNSAPEAVGFYERLGWTVIDPNREQPLLERRL